MVVIHLFIIYFKVQSFRLVVISLLISFRGLESPRLIICSTFQVVSLIGCLFADNLYNLLGCYFYGLSLINKMLVCYCFVQLSGCWMIFMTTLNFTNY